MATFLTWQLVHGADSGSYEIFSGAPDIEASRWVAADLMGYRKVIGTLTNDRGGLVFSFLIPDGVTGVAEVAVTGKLGTASQNAINVRVKDSSGTQVASGSITAATKTTLSLTSFSPAPDLTSGNRIIVEVEGHVDLLETAFLGECSIKFNRRP